MPSLNVDDLLLALEAPTLTLLGKTYELRRPSFTERLELERVRLATDWDDAASERVFLEAVCEVVGCPVEPLLELPEQILSDVVLFFLAISRGMELDAEVAESPGLS